MPAPMLNAYAVQLLARIWRNRIIFRPCQVGSQVCSGAAYQARDLGWINDCFGGAITAGTAPRGMALVFLGSGKSHAPTLGGETQFHLDHLAALGALGPGQIELGKLVQLVTGGLEDAAAKVGEVGINLVRHMQELAQGLDVAPPYRITAAI